MPVNDALLYLIGPLLGSDSEIDNALGDDGTAEGDSSEEKSDLGIGSDVLDEEAAGEELPVELKSRRLDKAR